MSWLVWLAVGWAVLNTVCLVVVWRCVAGAGDADELWPSGGC